MSNSGSLETSERYANLKQVCILGSGGWGSVVARIVARNVLYHKEFHPKVTMYVYEEFVDSVKLTDIINKQHENVKYAPGYKFTPNLIAIPDPVEAAKNADILVFVIPHQFVKHLCRLLHGRIKPEAFGVSLIKGFEKTAGGIQLISKGITNELNIPCYVLMGANIASEVAEEKVTCTSTLGCRSKKRGHLLKKIFNTERLIITIVSDENTVEICGALKNIIATGVGFVDGLGQSNRIKEAVIRLGVIEMIQFIDEFYNGGNLSTFFESCGMPDLIVTSFAGRNRKCADAFVKMGLPIQEVEEIMLKGQKLQGPATAEEVNQMLKQKNLTEKFPLFTVVHEICKSFIPPTALLKCIEDNISKRSYIPKNIKP